MGETQVNQLVEYLSNRKSKKVILRHYSDIKRLNPHQLLALNGALKHDNRIGITYLQNGSHISKVAYLREVTI